MPQEVRAPPPALDVTALLPALMLGRNHGDGSRSSSIIDVILVVLLPMLVRHMWPHLQDLYDKITSWSGHSFRNIIYTKRTDRWWHDDDDNASNAVIQKAILSYINLKLPDVARSWKEGDVQARRQERCHEEVDKSEGSNCGNRNRRHSDADEDSGSGASYLEYSFLYSPPMGVWVDLGNGIEIRRTESDVGEVKGRTYEIEVELRTPWRLGPRHITTFIQECVALYNEELRSKADSSRYLYTPTLTAPPSSSDGDKKQVTACALYKRYKLSENRTFASFFHPQREEIVRLVDQFLQKKGKFSIPGYPQKLGFLLHGPPGTGKTSFIKALAQYTGRHIVSIPLAKIKTNQELMDIMFDQRVMLAGGDDDSTPTSLPLSRVIFVMEDVDAASDVVHKRSDADCEGAEGAAAAGTQAPAAAAAAGTGGPAEGCDPGAASQEEALALAAAMAAAVAASSASSTSSSSTGTSPCPSRGRRTSSPGAPATPANERETGAAASTSSATSSSGGGAAGGGPAPAGSGTAAAASAGKGSGSGGGSGSTGWSLKELFMAGAAMGGSSSDALNLAGLLNALDGVVDAEGRIVVMTTNHPEKLDPALVRPGRINRKVYLGRMGLPQAQAMLRHYFSGGLPLEQGVEERLGAVFVDGVVSPAELEALCAEYDEVADLVEELEGRCRAARGAAAAAAALGKGAAC